jgi:hypothetical protein
MITNEFDSLVTSKVGLFWFLWLLIFSGVAREYSVHPPLNDSLVRDMTPSFPWLKL